MNDIADFKLKELELDEIAEWPRKYQGLFLLLLFILVQAALYWLFTLPQKEMLNRLHAQLISEKQELKLQSVQTSQLKNREIVLTELAQHFDALNQSAKREDKQPDTHTSLNLFAASNNLLIHRMEWKGETTYSGYVQQALDMEFSGGFHSMGSLLEFISGLGIPVGFERIELFREEQSRQEQNSPLLRGKLQALIYRFDNQWKQSISELFPDITYAEQESSEVIPSNQKLGMYKWNRYPDPFELSLSNQIKEPVSDNCVQPDVVQTDSPLQGYKLKDLLLKGFLSNEDQRSALIQTPDSELYVVSIGDRVGSEGGYILSVNQHDLLIHEGKGESCNPAQSVYWPRRLPRE